MTTPNPRPGYGPDLLSAALAYAARGWHVIPLAPGTKRPAFPDHPEATCQRRDPKCQHGHTNWEARATTDPDRITRAWSSKPYGIGIACGPSGLVVVDLDIRKPNTVMPPEWALPGVVDGADVFAYLVELAGKPVPATYTVSTRSGGTHLYFTHPAGEPLRNTTSGLGWLIDTRAHGGQVVAPPTHIDGAAYVVTDDRPPAPLPEWLADALRAMPTHDDSPVTAPLKAARGHAPGDRRAAYVEAAVRAEAAKITAAGEGRRNHVVFVAAIALGQLVAGGELPETHARAALLDAARAHFTARGHGNPFTPDEANRAITSGLRRGATRARTVAA